MRIEPRPAGEYPLWLSPFFASQKRRYGQVLVPGLLWARVPRLFAAVALLYGMLDRKSSPVAPVLRSLVMVRVSQLNGCRFCTDINAMTLAERAASAAKAQALEHWRESDLYDESERVALEYAEVMTVTIQRMSDELMARLKRHFSDDAIIELTALIAFQNLSSRFNAALDVPAQGFCR
jgi:AhpD family alkylhydroperoxidase